MKFLLKFFCLFSLLSSFAFSKEVWVYTDDLLDSLKPMKDCEFFLGKEFLKCTIPETGSYRIYSTYNVEDYLYFNPTRSSGYYYNTMYSYFIDKVQYSGYFAYVNKYSTYKYIVSDAQNGKLFTYTNITEFRTHNSFVECSVGDNFGVKSKKCFPACPAGQSWDYENEICYSDCTNKDLNKFGYSNGTTQGGCVDCSNAFTDQEIASCVCSGFGSGLSEKGIYLNLEGSSFVSYECADGSSITFKKRSNEKPDKDKDKDKDKEKDKNKNGNNDNTGEQDNNSSNNNSGGTSGNGSSGGGGTGVETKPNPNHNGDGKEDGKGDGKQDGKGDGKQDGKGDGKQDGKGDGKQGGKGEKGKGEDNAVAENLDFLDLEKDTTNFKVDYRKAIEDSFSFVNDVKTNLSDTISKIKDGNLMSLNKSNIPSSCPLEYKVNLIYFEKELIFDICKAISPVSQTLYYFFYFVFFVLFLLAVIKLFILTFMGW